MMHARGLELDIIVRKGDFTLDVELSVQPGEVVALLGPNGAGKTTLLRTIAGLDAIDEGVVHLAGKVLDEPKSQTCVAPEFRQIGYVFQDYRLFPHLNVLDNIAFPLVIRGRPKATARHRAEEVAAQFELTPHLQKSAADLSGGEAQRVALARVLIADPAALLLDEPLAALDVSTRWTMQNELKSHLSSFAGPILVVTHDPVEALALADRLVILESGRVVQSGTAEDIGRRPATSYVARLLGINALPVEFRGNLATLSSGEQLIVADAVAAGRGLVTVRPNAISVSRAAPEPSSVRNHVQRTVESVARVGDRMRLGLTGPVAFIADVTQQAYDELELTPGTPVWLSIKATEIDTYADATSASGE